MKHEFRVFTLVRNSPGVDPDGRDIEGDIALGIPGYVPGLSIKVTEAPVLDRKAEEGGWMGPREIRKQGLS